MKNADTKQPRLIERVKNFKIFEKKDALIYIGLALFVLCLFFIFSLPTACKNGQTNTGFKVTVDGKTAIIFEAQNSSPITVSNDFLSLVELSNSGEIFVVKIYSSLDKTSYNVIEFNKSEVSAMVTESTCSESKDCVYFPKLKNSGSIYCAPHKLKIQPLTADGFTPPTTG